jgi:hypothetical protein
MLGDEADHPVGARAQPVAPTLMAP